MTQILVASESGTQAIITPATPAAVVVSGLLKGAPGAKGDTGLTGPAGPTGPTGATGATGGIVPITVSSVAPSSPGVNDLWIDTS